MDFLLINRNKLKVKLTGDDMLKMGIDINATPFGDIQMKGTLWKILDIAHERSGFKFEGNRLLLQFQPYGEGGEIFVTKMGSGNCGIERSIARTENIAMLRSRYVILRIFELNWLIKWCRSVQPDVLEANASLYYSDSDDFYLMYEERDGNTPEAINCMYEFSEVISPLAESYILEHSIKIGNNDKMLRTLSEL